MKRDLNDEGMRRTYIPSTAARKMHSQILAVSIMLLVNLLWFHELTPGDHSRTRYMRSTSIRVQFPAHYDDHIGDFEVDG